MHGWQLVEKYGVDGALRMMAPGEPGATFDAAFVEAMEVFTAELERLDYAERAKDAHRERERQRREQ